MKPVHVAIGLLVLGLGAFLVLEAYHNQNPTPVTTFVAVLKGTKKP